jgi:hypothetical protein
VIVSHAPQVIQSYAHRDGEFQTIDQMQSSCPIIESPKVIEPGSAPLSASSDKSKSWFLGGGERDVDSKSSSSGGSGTSSKTGGKEFPWQLGVQATFSVAKAPPLERLLPVGNFNLPPLSPTVKTQPQSRLNEYGSPCGSPEMRSDMASLGPQVRVDESAVDKPQDDKQRDRSLSTGRDCGGDEHMYRLEEYAKALHQNDVSI